MTIDPRGRDDIKEGKDFIGTTVNFIDSENKWNIISRRQKLSATGLIDLMFTNWQRYNLHVIGIEDNQFTQGLKKSINDEMELRGVYMNVVYLKHGGNQKELRIEALVPRYERGGIYHITVDGVNQCAYIEEELTLFPKATNDDASDSLAYQEQAAARPDYDDEQAKS
jgi:phage terminase large subunit-like protein